MAVEAQKNIEENISHFMMQTFSQDTVSWQLHMTTNMADKVTSYIPISSFKRKIARIKKIQDRKELKIQTYVPDEDVKSET